MSCRKFVSVPLSLLSVLASVLMAPSVHAEEKRYASAPGQHPMEVFWGDPHIHTRISTDAAAQSFEAGVDQAEERALQKAMRAQSRVEDRILALRGVNGIGVSMDKERRPVLMIFVSRENEELAGAIPARVNGVPTKIVVAGPFAAL